MDRLDKGRGGVGIFVWEKDDVATKIRKAFMELQKDANGRAIHLDVMNVLTALAAGRAVPSDDDDKVSAARYRALASDDAYMRDLERLFNWLDRYATEARTQTLRIA